MCPQLTGFTANTLLGVPCRKTDYHVNTRQYSQPCMYKCIRKVKLWKSKGQSYLFIGLFFSACIHGSVFLSINLSVDRQKSVNSMIADI